MTSGPNKLINHIALAACVLIFPLIASAQSSDPNYPTAITTSEIDGTIRARDIGDSRVTSYYYVFDGGQGDVFVNVVTKNFAGDIDVFALEGLRPLTKMVIYPDNGPNETGRVIYMRKPERLILRVEGRSPNDDPATFRIKFAGSFVALAPQKQQGAPTLRQAEVDADSGVRVNSVGTIVAVIPKPQPTAGARPTPKEAVATVKRSSPPSVAKTKPGAEPARKEATATTQPTPSARPPAKSLPVTRPVKRPEETAKREAASTKNAPKKAGGNVATVFKKTPKPKVVPAQPAKPEKKVPPVPEPKLDPLAKIRLVVQFKDGNVIERPMSEIQKFSVDNGQLTVIGKDGTSVKYSILDVAKVTIE